MHVTTLINFNKIILSKRSEAQESRATWFHLYEILGKTSKLEMQQTTGCRGVGMRINWVGEKGMC